MDQKTGFSQFLREGQQANPPWKVAMFLGLGVSCIVISLVLMGFLHSYATLLILPIILVAPFCVGYGVAVGRQVYRLVLEHVTQLRWWHFLWLLIFISGLVLRKRSTTDITSAPVDSAAGLRLVLVTLTGCILLVMLFMRKTNWLASYCTGIPGFLTLFACVCLTSTLWSVYWPWTLYKSCEYGVDVALLAATLVLAKNAKDYKHVFDWTMGLYALLMVCVWIGVVVSPDQALSSNFEFGESGIGLLGVQLQGVFPDIGANGVGEYSAMLALICLCRLLPLDKTLKSSTRSWYLFGFLAMVTTMIMAQSRSPIGGFCIGVALLFLLSGRVGKATLIGVVTAIGLAFTSFYSLALQYLMRGQSTSEFESLSSRLEWWEFAIHQFLNAPLTGLGAWAAGRFAVLAKMGMKSTATVHSDWLEILVGTSIWGIIPIVIVLAAAWYILLRQNRNFSLPIADRQLAYEATCVLALLTARTVFMTDLTLHAPLHFFVVLGVAELLRRQWGFV